MKVIYHDIMVQGFNDGGSSSSRGLSEVNKFIIKIKVQ